LDELRKWATANFVDTEAFWNQFADKVCAAITKAPERFAEISSMYAEFEEHGADIRAKHDMQSWM
jgi:hypothetical protein